MDDTSLVAAIRAGDPVVAETFCRRVLPTVERTVRRLLGRDDGEREDLVQIAIIEIVRSIGRYRGASSLDTWVTSVTAHLVYKQIRRRSIERLVSLDGIQEEALPWSRSEGERSLATREILARIVKHLEAVGDKLAWTFVLHDVLGYDLGEVAQMMNASEAAAQSRLVRGRRRLHERIARDPELADLFVELAGRRAP